MKYRIQKSKFLPSILALSVVFIPSLQASSVEGYEPLYAGTQLAFYPTNAAPGHIAVQPYFFYTHRYGTYNSHWSEKSLKNIDNLSCLFSLETGITNWLDISLYLNGAYRRFGNENSWVVGDTSLFFGLQLLTEQKDRWTPDIRIVLGETFPTGKYDRLSPHKGGSDIFGTGSYVTTVVFILAKTFYTDPTHPYNLNLNLYYIQPSKASAHGLSLYGGTPQTRGTASPHSGFVTNLAIQYSLDRAWVLGMDMRYVHQNKTTFSGRKAGTPGLPSSEQFSLAPCVEYSWSENFSTAIGPWFTVAGRNTDAFFGIIGNFYSYF
jgi:hypothetical protein